MKNGHLLKSSKLVRSKKWRQIPDDTTRWVYCILVGAVDSWGMLPADLGTLKATLAPFSSHPAQLLTKSVQLLTRIGLVRYWEHQGDPWIYIEGHDENQRLRRRKGSPDVPRPDKSSPTPDQDGSTPEQLPTKITYDLDLDLDCDCDGDGIQPRKHNPMFDTTPPSTHTPSYTMPDEHEQIIQRLREHHAKLHHLEPRGFLQDPDVLVRISKVLTEYGEHGATRIIDEHHRQVVAGDIPKRARGFKFVFPGLKDRPQEPDWDWLAEREGGQSSVDNWTGGLV